MFVDKKKRKKKNEDTNLFAPYPSRHEDRSDTSGE